MMQTLRIGNRWKTAVLFLWTAVLLLCVLFATDFSVHAEAAASHSHTSSNIACPKCGKTLTVVGVKETTCTLRGYVEYNCDECNQYHEIVYVDLAPHQWRQISTTSPTCTDPGYVSRRCTVCGTTETKEVEEDQALGHSYQTNVIAPTCSSSGYTLHTCTRCGDSFQTDKVDPVEHTYSQTVITEPTCQGVGHLRNDCQVCGQYATEEIPMVEHSWKTETVAATHTAQGYTIYTCRFEGCNTVMRGDFTDLLPYDMEWNEVTTPTCTSSGVKVGHCVDGCGYTETVVLPYLGHTFDEWLTLQEAGKDSEGLESRACNLCGHTETRTVQYDPEQHAQPESVSLFTWVIILFLLIVGVAAIVLCFLLLMEHARRDRFKRKRKMRA